MRPAWLTQPEMPKGVEHVSNSSMEQTVAALGRMTVPQLRAKYLEVFGEPSRSGNRDFLFKRVAWRVQSLAEGGLSERARRRAEELARDSDIRTTVPRAPVASPEAAPRTVTRPAPTAHDRLPIPGTVLTRKYRGKQVEVTVLPAGFEYEGQTYRSLRRSPRRSPAATGTGTCSSA